MMVLRALCAIAATAAFVVFILFTPSFVSAKIIAAIAWPSAAIIVVLLFAFHPRLNRLFGMARAIRKIKAGGVEMEINTDVVDEVRTQLNESVDKLMSNAKDEYDRMLRVMRIPNYLQSVMTDCVPRVLQSQSLCEKPKGLRGTIHVQDIVFSEYLYQLTDYYPKRGGSGRRFSMRYGVIGRSWRLSESIGEGNAFEDKKGEERTLIENWGMTKEEVAARDKNSPSYLSIILRDLEGGRHPIGVLYVDSAEIEAFGKDDIAQEIASAIERSNEVELLSKELAKVMIPLRLAAPDMDIGHRSGRVA